MNVYNALPGRVVPWFLAHKRDLPWRRDRDPYRVWVSEVMLQQTRVEAVIPYYERFLGALPNAEKLARCPEDRLLKLWEGLGYYRRVRNMQDAAKRIIADFGGELPQEEKDLLALPGIGRYMAGAIASIAYGRSVPAVDGNVMRIMARLTADARPVGDTSFVREVTAGLRDALETEYRAGLAAGRKKQKKGVPDAGTFNQGMMDLGAMICLPNATPHCEACPLGDLCKAHKRKKTEAYPVRVQKKARRVEKRTVLVIRDGEKVILARRPSEGLLAGMYEFPNREGHIGKKKALDLVKAQGFDALRIREMGEAKHLFSHVEWQMRGYEIRVGSFPEMTPGFDQKPGAGAKPGSDGIPESNIKPGFDGIPESNIRPGSDWFLAEISDIEERYAIPSAYRAYTRQIALRQGKEKLTETYDTRDL